MTAQAATTRPQPPTTPDAAAASTAGPPPGDLGAAGLAQLVARRAPGRSLEAPFYTSPEVFDLDVAAVFARHWVFVATEPEIPEPGDYVTVDIGPYSVIVLRDDEEQVRAFHNVCRHRGARLLPETSGSVGNLVCGYHQWTYATDGRLLHAGQQSSGFDAGCWSLKQVHVRSVDGLVLVCLAPDPPSDIDDVAGRLRPYLAPHRLARTRVAAREDLVEHANWKLVMENNRECYHCEAGHPELTRTFFPTWGYAEDEIPRRLLPAHERYLGATAELEETCRTRDIPTALIREVSGRPTAFRVDRGPLDAAGESYTRDGRAVCERLLGDLDVRRLGRLSIHLQPNSWFHVVGDHAVTFTALPLAADRTLVRTTWLVHEDAVEGVDYDLATLTDVWHRTNAQDAGLVSRAQAGISDPAYEPGPYSPSESDVDAFVTWYVERLAEELG